MVVDNAVYRLSIHQYLPEIFAVKVGSCPKSPEFWTFFAFPNFKGAVPLNFIHRLTPPPSDTSRGKVSLG